MDFRLTALATVIVMAVAIVIGVVSAMLLRDGLRRTIWAWTVTIVFVVAACSAVIFEFSWMFSQPDRMVAQALALGAAMVAITYSIRTA
jgi:ABC-type sugar transport system permease subunit